MNRSRTIISALASLALGSLMASPALGALSASPNPSTTGSYTVSGSVTKAAYHNWVQLVETAPGGTTADFDVADAGNIGEAFSGKAVGTYTYQVEGCRHDLDPGNPGSQQPIVICEGIGAPLSVSVVSPPPADLMPDFGAATVPAKRWAQNSAISSFTVPAATGGNAPLSYAASGLPAGVSMTSSRRVSGTPSGHGSGTARVTVKDSDGDTATLSFAWAVAADLMPDFGDASVSYRSWSQNSAITAFTVPAASGGDAPLSYTISGLPAGLSMSGSRTISGTPTASGVGAATVTVRDADGDTDTLRFNWYVGADLTPTFGAAAIADKTFKQNAAIAAFYVPIASGGNWPLSYSATGLPAGVSLAGNRRVSGTPTAHGTGTATVKVTDNDGDTDTLDFDWTVNEDLAPSFATASVADKGWTLRTRIAAFTVPAATGGDGTLRYSASGLPSGVWMSSSTRRISGYPTGNDASSGTATVTARDADGDTATLQFIWSVEDPMPDFGQASLPDKAWTQNTAISRFTAPAASGGNSPVRYAASGLPDGVTMSSLRRFSGAPNATGSGTATVTVTDFDGDTDSIAFGWTVRQQDLRPTFTSRVPAKLWLRQAAVATFTVPAATGGDAPLSYSATGLPAGVSMSSARAVSGTPRTLGSGTATVTVTDNDGDTDTVSFDWLVYKMIDPPLPPPHKKWLKDQPIAAFTVPGASGGVAPLTYSISGLPNGVSMSSSRRVSGTPTSSGSGTAIVTITDANSDTDTVSFTWNVETDTEPSFGSASVSAKRWEPNSAISRFTVPGATGGNSPLSYTVRGLPAGVTMSSSRRVSGTPTATGTGTATIIVTDRDGDTDTLRFGWTVATPNRTPSFAGVTLSAKAWRPNRAIAAFAVPAATGGDGTLTYSATGLPIGVTMSSSRVVSGTPASTGSGSATVTARDGDGDTASISFNWSVAADLKPAFAAATLTNRDWTEGQAVTAFTVPTATGGDGSLTYTAAGLPSGVTMASSRSVSGTPGNSGSGTAIVTATDADGDAASIRFAWAVSPGPGDTAPTFGASTVAAQDWIVRRTIQNLTVPAATGGDGTITYTAAGLPGGVTMATARVVSGTPSMTGSGTAKVTATDADGDFATLTFKWTVYAASPVLSANPNPSTTSNFTVRWSAFRTNDQDYFLVETAPGGGTTSYAVDIKEPKHFIAKPDGTYAYRMKGCRAVYDRDTQAQVYRCTDLGNALTVTVDGPEPDTVAKQLNYTYTAHAGDFDDNTHTDLLIKRTSSGVGAGIFRTVILSQKTMGQFTLVAPSETEVMTASAYPVASNVSLVLGDYNLDGFVDILLRGLSTAVTGALDRIVYAPGGKTGGHPTVLNAVDEDFTKFLTQTTSWIRDNDYFVNNAVTVPIVSTGITVLYHCQESDSGNTYYADYPCPFDDTPIGEIHEPFVNVVNVISYEHFNQDALAFSRQFSLVDGRIDPDVTLGSQQALNLSSILKRVFGTDILNGQLESACTGFFAYDSTANVSCRNGNEVGLILLHHGTELIQVLQGYDPTADRQVTPVGRQRDLTENEVTLAENNGLDTIDLTDVRIEHSSAFYVDEDGRARESAWWVDRAHPNTIFVPKLFVSRGGQFVNRHFEEDFTSIDKQAVLIHELTHVHQGMDGNWIHGGRGTETGFHRYGYRDSDGNLEHNDFSLYSEEEQAEIMEDRFRLKSGQSPDFSSCDDSAEPCNAPSSLTIAQMYGQLDMLDNIPEDED